MIGKMNAKDGTHLREWKMCIVIILQAISSVTFDDSTFPFFTTFLTHSREVEWKSSKICIHIASRKTRFAIHTFFMFHLRFIIINGRETVNERMCVSLCFYIYKFFLEDTFMPSQYTYIIMSLLSQQYMCLWASGDEDCILRYL